MRQYTTPTLLLSACMLFLPYLIACDEEQGACDPGDSQPCDCGDFGTGFQVCKADASGWSECNCEDPICGTDPPSVSGDYNTEVSEIAFDAADVELEHKRDVDEFEDGCITRVEIELSVGGGCWLRIIAGEYLTELDNLEILDVEFTADSFCPGFADDIEGTYVNTGGLTTAEVEVGAEEVPGDNVAESCVQTDIHVLLEGLLNRESDSAELVVDQTEIVIDGEFESTGDTESSCPAAP